MPLITKGLSNVRQLSKHLIDPPGDAADNKMVKQCAPPIPPFCSHFNCFQISLCIDARSAQGFLHVSVGKLHLGEITWVCNVIEIVELEPQSDVVISIEMHDSTLPIYVHGFFFKGFQVQSPIAKDLIQVFYSS
jgi:hypothetical protein